MSIFLWVWLLFSFVIVWVYLYQMMIAFAGFKQFTPAPISRHIQRFAVIVPAHDEANVIRETLESILGSEYPHELFRVIVIADNCSDDTADIARSCGAYVLERSDPVKRGKGHALRWAFPRVKELGDFDAFIIIDSDNILTKSFLRKMNDEMNNGNEVIQGYLGTKNPNDNWVTGTIYATYCFINRFFELSRENLGLCCPLGGTGVCISSRILDVYGWEFTSLTEDLELTTKLAVDGVRVRYAYHARVFDEKPRTLYAALKQRQRWMAGHALVMRKYLRKLIFSGIKNVDPLPLDAALYIGLPLLMTFWAMLEMIRAVFFFDDDVITGFGTLRPVLRMVNLFILVSFSSWWIIVPLIAIKLEGGKPLNYWYSSFLMMLMAWIMLFLFVTGLFNWDHNNWWHTKHGAEIDTGIKLDD